MRFSKKVRKRRYIEAERLYDTPWTLTQAALNTQVASHQAAVLRSEQDIIDDDEELDRDYPIDADGVACISISGILTAGSYWNTTSYRDIAASISHALNNSAVAGILLRIDSPGGEVTGLFDLSDAIYLSRSIKPIVARVESCFSAAYCIASSADKVFVSRTGATGSIGCYTSHVSYAGMLQQQGIQVEMIASGDRKLDGNPTQPLSAIARAALKAEVDRIRNLFAETVSRNRNVSKQALMNTEAACFPAETGIPLLADEIEIGTMNSAAAYLRSRLPAKSVAPRSQRFTAPAKALPAAQPMIQDHDHVAGLLASAFGEGRPGFAEIQLTHGESMQRFGTPGAILAVRSFAQPQSRASAPIAERKISMLVCPYDGSTCNLGNGLTEKYSPGCFSTGLNQDPRVLWGHDEQRVLGRKSAGNARFWEASDGLHAEVDCVNTSYSDDLLELVRTQTVNQSSASFWIIDQSIENRGSERIRTVKRAILRDASIVSWAAYPHTSAQLQLPAASQAALPAAAGSLAQLQARQAQMERESRINDLRLQIAQLPSASTERNRLRLELARL
jgi:capsid assembly protease